MASTQGPRGVGLCRQSPEGAGESPEGRTEEHGGRNTGGACRRGRKEHRRQSTDVCFLGHPCWGLALGGGCSLPSGFPVRFPEVRLMLPSDSPLLPRPSLCVLCEVRKSVLTLEAHGLNKIFCGMRKRVCLLHLHVLYRVLIGVHLPLATCHLPDEALPHTCNPKRDQKKHKQTNQ